MSELRADQSMMMELEAIDPTNPVPKCIHHGLKSLCFSQDSGMELDKELPPMPEMDLFELNPTEKEIESKEVGLMSLDETEAIEPQLQSAQPELQSPEVQQSFKKNMRTNKGAPNRPRKRIKLLKVDDIQGLQIGAKKYKKWMHSTEEWIVDRPKKKQKRWNIEELLLPHHPTHGQFAETSQLFSVFEDLITFLTKPKEPATSIKKAPLPAPLESTPMIIPMQDHEDGLLELPEMDAPMRDELLITEPNALIQSQEIGSAPSQIDKLRAALSSPMMQNLDLGKTPGSSVGPNRNDGSDLSSLLASRNTNPKGTPGTGPSLSQTCNSELPLLPILEEDHHHSAQENINFLPETHFDQSFKIRENESVSNQPFVKLPFSDSTLAVVEFLKQTLDEDSMKGDCTTFFQLSEGLSRLEAAKLFYQICVIKFHDYVGTYQAAAFSDVVISHGKNMRRDEFY